MSYKLDSMPIIEAYLQGRNLKDIANEYNVYPWLIRRILTINNILIRPKGAKPGSVPHNKGKIAHNKIDNNEYIESGKYLTLNECSCRSRVKRYLIEKNGNVCSICSNATWNNRLIPLICDHIDGDSKNNLLSNFRIVCCNCDAQLPTYKSKNKGKGRKYDRDYYRKNLES